jgi:transcriptional regulator with XRE-family HTH domain
MNRIPIDEDGGAQLRALREKKKLTVYELSERLGVAQSTISKLETAYARSMPEDLLSRWGDALGVVVSYSPPELSFRRKRR